MRGKIILSELREKIYIEGNNSAELNYGIVFFNLFNKTNNLMSICN